METEKRGDAGSGSGIELRSEKTRKMIGEIPPLPVRLGLAAIIAMFCLLAAALALVEYPYGGGETIMEHIAGGGK